MVPCPCCYSIGCQSCDDMPRNLRPSTTNARQHGYQPYPPRPRSEHATTRASTQWPKADDELLFDLRAKGTSWKDIAELIGHDRTQEACRQRHKRKGEEKKRDATFDPNVLARAYVENHEAMFSMVVRNMPGVDWQEAERFIFQFGLKDISKMARKHARQGHDAEDSDSETDTTHQPTHAAHVEMASPGYVNGRQQQPDEHVDQTRPQRTGGGMSITSMLSHPPPSEQDFYNHGEGRSHHPTSHHTYGQSPPQSYDTASSNGNSRGRRHAGR